MSKLYAAVGPFNTQSEVEDARDLLLNDGYRKDRLRVIRLRPKGQGLAARLAAVEAALSALATEHASLVQRVSDLEREPASPAEASAEVASAPEPTHLPSASEVARVGEHGRADADAAMDLLRGKLSAAREEIARLKAATPARDPLRDPRPTATQPTKAEMAAELRAAGWRQGQVSGHWYMRPSSEPHTTADAYAAMRAGKVAT